MEKELEKIGFTSYEATVYLALLDSGITGAGELVKRTQLHRNVVYDTLDRLLAKALIFKFVQKNVARFQVTDPNRILERIRLSQSLAEQIVPELEKRGQVKQDIVLYEGLEGFRTFSIENMARMDPGSTLYVLGSVGNLWYELMGDAYKRYEKLRLKNKVRLKMVSYVDSEMERRFVQQRSKLYEIRFMPQNTLQPGNMLITQDSVVLQTLVEPYSVVEIRNRLLAQSYLAHFDLLWNQAVAA